MEQQIDSIGIYADSIVMKDSMDWELKLRRAVIENSTEYKQEMAAKQAIGTIVEETTETVVETKKEKQPKNSKQQVFQNDWNTFLLVLIAFLLFLNLIFNK